MFTKPLTRAPRYILIKSFFLAIGQSYLHDLSSHTFLKSLKLLWGEIACQKRFVSTDNGQTSQFSFSYRISNGENLIPNYLDKDLTFFSLNFANIEKTVLAKKAPVNDFLRLPVPRIFNFAEVK